MSYLCPMFANAELPFVGNEERALIGLERWRERAAGLDDQELGRFARGLPDEPAGRRLLAVIFGNSPFLTQCVLAEVEFFLRLLAGGPDAAMIEVLDRVRESLSNETERDRLMAGLRIARRRTALLVALTDITGIWSLSRVTESLGDFADVALSAAISHLLRAAAARAELGQIDEMLPEEDCGLVVLGMGKYGARELNYSSDIDLIVLYDPLKIDHRGQRSLQQTCMRITRDVVALMERRTAEGYVFRTDLRLRPDPSSSPVAVPYASAISYYEHRGQDWERAAMIKARPVAGDLALGREFLRELSPFIWRENLDFWAMRAIQSIKRQIDRGQDGGEHDLAGRNVKLGRGGIREIEFFAQTQQLAYGGRDPYLRCPKTLDALATLAEAGHLAPGVAEDLSESYEMLRQLEHRLQMVDDRQTQTLPGDRAGMAAIAAFMGYSRVEGFVETLGERMRAVQRHYGDLFEATPGAVDAQKLLSPEGSFEPETLDGIRAMGFSDPARVVALARAWVDGDSRDWRRRELLVDLLPTLLGAAAKTGEPERTLNTIDELLGACTDPSRFIALLAAHSELVDLLAEFASGAPALMKRLRANPRRLETTLRPGFYHPFPDERFLQSDWAKQARRAESPLQAAEILREWADDQTFHMAVKILRHTMDARDSGRALSHIADTIVRALSACSRGEPGAPETAILALDDLGARETTLCSDISLVFVRSDTGDGRGGREEGMHIASRFAKAFAQAAPWWRLRGVDAALRDVEPERLEPISLETFERQVLERARPRDCLRLVPARVVVGENPLRGEVRAAVRNVLTTGDRARLRLDVEAARGESRPVRPALGWCDLAGARGALADLTLVSRYLQVQHAAARPELLDEAPREALLELSDAGLVETTSSAPIVEALRLLREVENYLGAAGGSELGRASAPTALGVALAHAAGTADFEALETKLAGLLRCAHAETSRLVEAGTPEAH